MENELVVKGGRVIDPRVAGKSAARVRRIEVHRCYFQDHPDYDSPETFVESIWKLVESGRLEVLNVH